MAEVVGVVGTAVGVAGFAGQIAQGAKFVYKFLKDVKGAPQYLHTLNQELLNITTVLELVSRSFVGHDNDLATALKQCHDIVHELTSVQHNLEAQPQSSRSIKAWKQLHTALKKSNVTEYTSKLERAKTQLIHCCQAASQKTNNEGISVLRDTKDNTAALSGLPATATADDIRNQASGTLELLQRLDSGISRIDLQQAVSLSKVVNIVELAQNLEAFHIKHDATTSRIEKTISEIATLICRFSDDSEYLREGSHEITTAKQRLEQADFMSRAGLEQSIREELGVSIGRTVARHLIRALGADPTTAGSFDTKEKEERRPEKVGEATKSPLLLRIPNRHPEPWIRLTSKVINCTHLYTYFGTLQTRTVTMLYSFHGDGDDDNKKGIRERIHTSYSFIPAAWLWSTGAIVKYDAWKRWNSQTKPSPEWSLRSIHIRHTSCAIFDACQEGDLEQIQRLFANGEASPFDVDISGRNLIGFLGLATKFDCDLSLLADRISKVLAILELLINYGVEVETSDTSDLNPIMIFSNCWGESLTENVDHLEETTHFIFAKLMRWAQTNPFICQSARLIPQFDGTYNLQYKYPDGEISPFPFLSASDALLKQREWPIPWDENAILSLCSLERDGWISERQYVSFWVTSTSEEVDKYLTVRIELLQKLLHTDAFELVDEYTMQLISHNTIHFGGMVVALLSKHSYWSEGSPWLRHRFRKLIRVSAFVRESLAILLVRFGHQMDKACLEDVLQHALKHDARMANAWIDAVEEATECLNPPNTTGAPIEIPAECSTTVRHTQDEISVEEQDHDWESDDDDGESSCWETEEEWEEGYQITNCVDVKGKDAFNHQLDDDEREHMRHHSEIEDWKWLVDYDHIYWSHVYTRVEGSKSNTAGSHTSPGILKRASKAIAGFLSYVV